MGEPENTREVSIASGVPPASQAMNSAGAGAEAVGRCLSKPREAMRALKEFGKVMGATG